MLACPVCATPERDGRGRNQFEELYRLTNGESWLHCLNPDCGEEFASDEAAVLYSNEKHLACGHLLSDIVASDEGTHFCAKCETLIHNSQP